MHAVEKVHFTHPGVSIQEEQVELGELLLKTFLHPFGDDVVGDAAERLQSKHVLNAILNKSRYFRC